MYIIILSPRATDEVVYIYIFILPDRLRTYAAFLYFKFLPRTKLLYNASHAPHSNIGRYIDLLRLRNVIALSSSIN